MAFLEVCPVLCFYELLLGCTTRKEIGEAHMTIIKDGATGKGKILENCKTAHPIVATGEK